MVTSAKTCLWIHTSLHAHTLRHLATDFMESLEVPTWLLAWFFSSSSEGSCAPVTLWEVLQPMAKLWPSASPCCRSREWKCPHLFLRSLVIHYHHGVQLLPGPVAIINSTTEGFLLVSWHTDVTISVQAPSSEVERESVSSVQAGDGGLKAANLCRSLGGVGNLLGALSWRYLSVSSFYFLLRNRILSGKISTHIGLWLDFLSILHYH